jgi:hypothetical protein
MVIAAANRTGKPMFQYRLAPGEVLLEDQTFMSFLLKKNSVDRYKRTPRPAFLESGGRTRLHRCCYRMTAIEFDLDFDWGPADTYVLTNPQPLNLISQEEMSFSDMC